MKIVGPEQLVFGVEDAASCRSFLLDYGLTERADGALEALDGTSVVVRDINDPSLPAGLSTGNRLRKTVWGVSDQATIDAIEAELGTDRDVVREADGSITTKDDLGFVIGFTITKRRAFDVAREVINTPGADSNRGLNQVGANENAEVKPITLSHVVYFVPDFEKMERFYVDRLNFAVSDRFLNMGPFLRPRGSDDHHSLFLIQTPENMQGLEHFAFHVQGPSALMLAGTRMIKKGYESFWGPGRHKMGSNWFWYFKSPLGVAVEYDADMDKHDDDWVARVLPQSVEHAQLFLFESREKWAPGGPPPTAIK
jgi:catechol 2,3-dioxygenase-like lactoylglutathione lyase family enzyme